MKEEIRQHKFTCDRCGRFETTDDYSDELVKNLITYPDGWKKYGGIDLCGRCGDGFELFMGGDKYDLNDLAKDIHETAKEKGWHEEGNGSDRIPTLLALVHSEVSEALEAYRCWGTKDISDFIPNLEERYNGKPGGFPSELADVTIRVLDICALYDIDIQAAIGLKMAYNKTRQKRHGGKRC